MKHTKKQIHESIRYWQKVLENMEGDCIDEAGADDILARWNASHRAEVDDTPKNTEPEKPKKIISYMMGNNTHTLYNGDMIIGMYMQKDTNCADYAIYRISRFNIPKFKSLKGKTQTSTLKNFLINNAEKIEGEERGRMTLDKFIEEMKRIVGPASYQRVPVLFTAGMQKNNFHYSANPRHRGKTTFTTQTTGHITYDLDDFKFDGSTIDNYSGKTKTQALSER